ncbi:MAG: hypothetical protein WBE14_14215, partial [Xanthobacteraceae bacterium]
PNQVESSVPPGRLGVKSVNVWHGEDSSWSQGPRSCGLRGCIRKDVAFSRMPFGSDALFDTGYQQSPWLRLAAAVSLCGWLSLNCVFAAES